MPFDSSTLPTEAQKALSLFPEFEVRDFNDSGANAYVLIGRHRVLRKKVAIKIYFHGEKDIDQEPTIISTINHPNVLKVYDARRVESDCSFYLMPAAKEGDLAQFLDKYTISTHLAHTLLCQLLSGIAALHGSPKNLVHRDLKPENLLIDNDNMLIADFGSVRKIDASTGKATASKHSVLYRPPESFGSEAYFDYSSDVYQAGCIGYLLFGGKLSNYLEEYLNRNEKAALRKVKQDGGDFKISEFIDSCIEKKIKGKRLLNWDILPCFVPNTIITVLKRATCEKNKRYTNTSEFLAQLSKVRSNFPDWLITSEGYELYNWKGIDYLICEDKGKYVLKKKKTSSSDFRADRSITGDSQAKVYNKLKRKIKLP
jgi:serine/threonine protein kinase